MLKAGDKDRITCQSRSVVHAILSRKGSGLQVRRALQKCGTVHCTTEIESLPHFKMNWTDSVLFDHQSHWCDRQVQRKRVSGTRYTGVALREA